MFLSYHHYNLTFCEFHAMDLVFKQKAMLTW